MEGVEAGAGEGAGIGEVFFEGGTEAVEGEDGGECRRGEVGGVEGEGGPGEDGSVDGDEGDFGGAIAVRGKGGSLRIGGDLAVDVGAAEGAGEFDGDEQVAPIDDVEGFGGGDGRALGGGGSGWERFLVFDDEGVGEFHVAFGGGPEAVGVYGTAAGVENRIFSLGNAGVVGVYLEQFIGAGLELGETGPEGFGGTVVGFGVLVHGAGEGEVGATEGEGAAFTPAVAVVVDAGDVAGVVDEA